MGRDLGRAPCAVAAVILSMPPADAESTGALATPRPCGPGERLLADLLGGAILIWNVALVNLARTPEHLWFLWPLLAWLLILALHTVIYVARYRPDGPPQPADTQDTKETHAGSRGPAARQEVNRTDRPRQPQGRPPRLGPLQS